MSWDNIWDEVFRSQPWGKYPSEDVIRFVARNFYKAPDRSSVKILEVGCGPGANLWYIAKERFAALMDPPARSQLADSAWMSKFQLGRENWRKATFVVCHTAMTVLMLSSILNVFTRTYMTTLDGYIKRFTEC